MCACTRRRHELRTWYVVLASSEEETAAALLPNVEDMIHELECMESAQTVRADVTLPADVNAVSRVLQQQQVLCSMELFKLIHLLSLLSFSRLRKINL